MIPAELHVGHSGGVVEWRKVLVLEFVAVPAALAFGGYSGRPPQAVTAVVVDGGRAPFLARLDDLALRPDQPVDGWVPWFESS